MSDAQHTVSIQNPKPQRRWLQFGLGSLLCVSLLSGLFFGLAGKWLKRQPPPQHLVVYQVEDLLLRQAAAADPRLPLGAVNVDFDTLMTDIQSQVATETWRSNGGHGAMEAFPTNLSLVILQTKEVHESIAQYLTQARGAAGIPVTPPVTP